MRNKVFQVGFLVASIFAISNVAYAETVTIHTLAIESYSKEFNVSSQEAERRLIIESQLDYIVQKLNEEFDDSISSIYFDNGKEFKLVIRTTKKGNTQKRVMNLADQLSKDYSLPIDVVANSPRNFRAIQNIIENQKSRITKKHESLQMIGYVPEKDAIRLSFYEPDITKQNGIKSAFQKVSGMDTLIEFLPEPISAKAGIGGGGLLPSTNPTGVCTGGFIGTMNGKQGILTATHCMYGKTLSTYGNSGGGLATNVGIAGQIGKDAIMDSQYHEISFLPLDATKYPLVGNVQKDTTYAGITQTIIGIGYAKGPTIVNNQYVGGTQVCHIGQTTGYSCGTVSTVSAGFGGQGCNSAVKGIIPISSCTNTYIDVRGSGFKIASGDSGGPLFDSSGKAYGIASFGGRLKDGSGYAGQFSSLAYVSGFTLKTGG